MFEQGREYHRRRDLHAKYGGQEQGGICTPSKHPFIMIFTGEPEKDYGYEDGWKDGLYHYTGEGQVGDMTFTRGNRAIRDHLDNGKELHLFKKAKNGHVQYVGQMACRGYHETVGPDRDGHSRKVIVFELVAVD